MLHVAYGDGQCGSATDYQPRTREYWIVIEETDWNYIPQGRNEIKGTSLEDDVFTESNEGEGFCLNFKFVLFQNVSESLISRCNTLSTLRVLVR